MIPLRERRVKPKVHDSARGRSCRSALHRRCVPSVEAIEDRTVLSPILYADDAVGRLFTVDVATGSVSVIGTMSAVMFDIAFDPSGVLYGVDGTSALYRIDASTAATTRIGSLGAFVNSLVFSTDGTLYGAGTSLYRINVATGSGTLIGSLGGFTSAGDLAFDASGRLFLSTASNDLVRVDRTSGSATLVGPIGFADVLGLAFGSDRVMYGLSNRTQQVFSVNLTTGQGTLVSAFGGKGVTGVNGSSFREEAMPPPVQISIADASIGEGNSGSRILSLSVSLSTAASGPVTVQYATASGTATEGVDFTATTGQLSFDPGQTSKTVQVPIIGDTTPEADETFQVTLSSPTGATILRGTAQGTIIDDDQVSPPAGEAAVQFSRASYSVAENAGKASILVTRTGDLTGTVTVHYATANRTALQPRDYLAASGILTFGPSETSKSIAIRVIDDTQDLPDVALLVRLDSPSDGAALHSPSTATLTIRDNDGPPVVPPTSVVNVRDVRVYSRHGLISAIQVGFSGPINPTIAQDPTHYHLVFAGADGRYFTRDDRTIGFRSATYEPTRFFVTLTPSRPVRNFSSRFTIDAFQDTAGRLIDGDRDGKPGGFFYSAVLQRRFKLLIPLFAPVVEPLTRPSR